MVMVFIIFDAVSWEKEIEPSELVISVAPLYCLQLINELTL
jgi:hypothetical protein